MKYSIKKKILLHKAYFDRGLGITSYFKYLIAFFGIASNDVKATMIIAAVYGIACYVLGWLWILHKLADAEADVNNSLNPLFRKIHRRI